MKTQEVGYVISRRNFLVYLDGLPSVQINDLVESESGIRGMVSALLPNKIEVLLLDDGAVLPGQMFKKSAQRLAVSTGNYLLGRAINPLGVPIDGKDLLSKTADDDHSLPLDQTAKGIQARKFITDQFVTGITLVDSLIPLGKGQRELVLGDAHAGKTSFLIDLIVSQKDKEVICIYAMIGKPIMSVRNLLDILTVNQAIDHTVVIAASSSEPAPLIYLTPQTAFTIAEYFQRLGKDVLLLLDDMGNHAKVYREISLLSNRAPGKESYPGDIFYQHSHLLERAGNFKPEFGGGSITALPVIELNLNDFTTLIPTNLMSMTDGHLMFDSSLSHQGQHPAIDIPLSVSRVGRQTQNRVQNLLSQKVRQILAQAQDLETISRFSSELPYETQLVLKQKDIIKEIIRQDSLTSIPLEIQTVMLGLVFTSFFKDQPAGFVRQKKNQIMQLFTTHPNLKQLPQTALNLKTDQELITLLETVSPLLKQLTA